MESPVIARIAPGQWHALDDDLVVGRGDASPRPDGRIFVSIDAWQWPVFDRLAEVMLAALPRPLYTVVDEADDELTATWRRTGFATRRREWEYVVPTAVPAVPPPAGVTILPPGAGRTAPLRELDRAIRSEFAAADLPAEIIAPPIDPARYTVAASGGEYVGLARVAVLRGHTRIGLVAVRSDHRRRGIGRALLAEVLGAAHARGERAASADVHESNLAAVALFDGVGARPAGSNLELVIG